MRKPKKWHEIYPAGTTEGDEEAKVFKILSRHPKWSYLSISSIVNATNLTKERVEEIIDKYTTKIKPPLIYPHQENDDSWGYWERCPERLKTDHRSIAQKDIDRRIAKHREKPSAEE
jgi:hypothetical protein